MHTLTNWLVNHIKHDDRDYTGVVKENMQAATQRVKAKKGSWMSGYLADWPCCLS